MKLFPIHRPKTDSAGIRFLFCICLSVLCAATVISALPTNGEEAIYDRVIRLHVLANSDTEEDQALKLRVRDAVLDYLESASVSAGNADDAEAAYRALLCGVEETAEATAASLGYPYDCRVTLTRETYPVRHYENITLPAGTYRSLRVQIGEAAGQNWWCVLFPPLCLSLAADAVQYEEPALPAAVWEDDSGTETNEPATNEDTLLAAGFTPYEVSLISGDSINVKTVVKFRIVEFFRTLFRN